MAVRATVGWVEARLYALKPIIAHDGFRVIPLRFITLYLPPTMFKPQFSFTIPDDYEEHLECTNVRLDHVQSELALWIEQQSYVVVVAPATYAAKIWHCWIEDALIHSPT